MTEAAMTIYERGWIFRVIPPAVTPPRLAVVFIHGWKGNETVMEVFSRGLPEDALALFPRGSFAAPDGGYGWVNQPAEGWPDLADFEPAARALMVEIELRLKEMKAKDVPLRLAGFSQGAAMCHALTLLFPKRIDRTAILSGFLPRSQNPLPPGWLEGKPYFVSHGSLDETIPIRMAKEGVVWLRQAGAVVDYCESNTAHKMALDCVKQLREFLYT